MGLLFLILQLGIAGLFVFMCLSFITGGPFVPSGKKRVSRMMELARVNNKSILYDIGSGDGRILFAAASRGAHAVGIEINPYLVWFTRIKAFFSPFRDNITVRWQNLWTADIRNATIVSVYLFPWRMEELANKLKRELKPGTRIVCNSFIFPHWKIEAQDTKNHIYVFKI